MRRALFIARHILTLVGAWFLVATGVSAARAHLQPRTHWTACVVENHIDDKHWKLYETGECKEGEVTLDIDTGKQKEQPE